MVHRGICPRMYFRRSSSTKSRTYIESYKNGGGMLAVATIFQRRSVYAVGSVSSIQAAARYGHTQDEAQERMREVSSTS